ncbi:MAG: penicillin-binding protein 2 [Chloroflexi bacterium]|nr:penicillin-binding protein 2 [Chloroflexota bacterium]MBV9898220.1 penicillin-binding protein 2 [Chloroflexota bacterium]
MIPSLERPEPVQTERGARPSTWLFRGMVLLLFGILTAQLWRLQVVDGQLYTNRSVGNRLRQAVIPPQRGVIYDRNKTILASNAPIFAVSITPADVPTGRMQEIVIRVANELRVVPDDIQRVIDAHKVRKDYNPYTSIPVAYNVDREAVMRISEHSLDMPGVQVGIDSTRRYNEGTLIAHLIGYMGAISPDEVDQLQEQGYGPDDHIGAAGIEQAYEKDLRGQPGKRSYEVEATGQEVAELQRQDPQNGNNLVLSIDLDLQRDVMQILQQGLRNAPGGAAIVMDPRNGEILAMVSTPSFDANIIGDPSRDDELQQLLNDKDKTPMFPRAFAGQYPPGSVFKLVTGSAALQEGVANKDTVIDSKGVMYVDSDQYPGVRQPFNDNAPYGPQTFFQGVADSSNIYFFWLGGGYSEGNTTIFEGLGVDRLAKYARAYGYGSRTGLDISGEQDGIIPDPTWKEFHENQPWFKGDTYNMAIGQGDVLATPLQVANTTNAIANGGTVYQPHLARQELDAEGNVVRDFSADPPSRTVPVDPTNLATMRAAMEWSFEGPWLKWFKIPGLRVAGKTGTAEYQGPPDAHGSLPTHGWFTGFAPAENPEITVTVFVESGSGTNDASPIGMRIVRRYFHLPDISPDPPKLPPAPQTAPRPPQ